MIDILLATFNGEVYLSDLLRSIEFQTFPDWKLIIRDDGSTDGTRYLIERWAKEHPEKVRVLQSGPVRIGPCANFATLLEASRSPYFMCCDQDDVWLPDKISLLLSTIQKSEQRFGNKIPVLAHSDLVVVDENLYTLHASFWREQRITRGCGLEARRKLLLQNPVTGCASIGNAALRKTAAPIPADAVMHDWWLALVAGYIGQLAELEVPTILYRQHKSNASGAKERRLDAVLARLLKSPADALERTQKGIDSTQRQAAAFLSSFSYALDVESQFALHSYARLREATFIDRKLYLLRHGLWPKNWIHGAAISLCM